MNPSCKPHDVSVLKCPKFLAMFVFPGGSKTKINYRNRHFHVRSVFRMLIDLLTGTIKQCSVKANAKVRNVLNLEM